MAIRDDLVQILKKKIAEDGDVIDTLRMVKNALEEQMSDMPDPETGAGSAHDWDEMQKQHNFVSDALHRIRQG